MAKDLKSVSKQMKTIRKAMGLKGDNQPGQITMKARALEKPTPRKVLPSPHTKKGLAIRGLI